MRIYKNDIIKASAISTDDDRGLLLCSITDSGFTSIASVISAVKDKLPNKDHKKMVFEILNDTKKEYGRYNNCGTNNRRRRLFELQQAYRKINDLRSDFQWGLAHDLCKQYDYIFIEDLNIEGMKRLWGKKVSDLSHSSFIDKLTYVASKYGVTIHKIDKWYPSSKTCECGCINKGLSLRDRTWACPACGAVNDRDALAARNILRKGISELESMGNSGCRNAGVPYVCIQESHSL